MREVSLSTVSDILDSFDVEEISKLLEEQIMERENYAGTMVDQYQPLYYNYTKLIKSEDAEDEELLEGKNKFFQICYVILGLLRRKFNIELDSEWVADNLSELPAITLALYSFFIMDLYSNTFEVIKNYISKNYKELAMQFKDIARSQMSDAGMDITPEAKIIMANIYDISTFILSNLSSDNVTKYLDKGYIPMIVIDQLIKKGVINGDFVLAIANIFNSNISFKSQIGFDLIYMIRTGTMSLSPTKIK